jgi:hypothetical protein
MNQRLGFGTRASVVILLMAGACWALGSGDETGLLRTQELVLSAGWNAVFLEVEPKDPDPAGVFAGVPVDKVARLFNAPASNQFVTDPGVDLFKAGGWGVWYASQLPEAFLKSLDRIEGNVPYLVHATKAFQWRVTGGVRLARNDWKADAYNLVGFPVRSAGGPTFGEFFAGSPAHLGQPIYRMVNGRWKKVLSPNAETMRSGEAFWIYCAGPSDFSGPLRVETASLQGLLLGRGGVELVLRNECPHPLTPELHHLAGGAAPVPLSILVRRYGDPAAPVESVAVAMSNGAWRQPMPPLEANASIAVPFECRAAAMGRPCQTSLLKITTDIGTETWVPVMSFRDDLVE